MQKYLYRQEWEKWRRCECCRWNRAANWGREAKAEAGQGSIRTRLNFRLEYIECIRWFEGKMPSLCDRQGGYLKAALRRKGREMGENNIGDLSSYHDGKGTDNWVSRD